MLKDFINNAILNRPIKNLILIRGDKTNKEKLKDILAITTLRKLIENKHLVKEDIFLGKAFLYTVPVVSSKDQPIDHLYLTQKGLVRKVGDKSVMFEDIYYGIIIRFCLEHDELSKILEKLKKNEKS